MKGVLLAGLILMMNFSISKKISPQNIIKLPPPKFKGEVSLEEVLKSRRSIRSYKDSPLTLEEVSQLVWAGQGITTGWGGRTAPSAGALYPLEIYLVVGKVEGIDCGVYHYQPQEHSLIKIEEGDRRGALFSSALFQSSVKEAPLSFVICAEYQRTTKKYGKRGERYVHMEAGHVGQNICLQAQALGLATVVIGAFMDKAVKKVLGVKEKPLYIIPVGRER